ncbi:hypothetical protein C8A05DRAFT_37568 [Staphylotrichum tortipilum]|uniref:Small EDRK-rich factor-like N-terminal domain-containing protein n=1 Tax=Staphylotrichum tortipilum TaxID=2831512 RepID=A0AAN6RPP0_9PEZI|nr:hypothetical protein C8A05DRAFT_37568 [Staphylotrichum longicolle]
MARGNQRDKAREAAQKKLAAAKKGHGMSGSELAKAKEVAAQKMREKQAAGMMNPDSDRQRPRRTIKSLVHTQHAPTDAKKNEVAADKK